MPADLQHVSGVYLCVGVCVDAFGVCDLISDM